jgi:predicted RNase H-like HicB family nuclease
MMMGGSLSQFAVAIVSSSIPPSLAGWRFQASLATIWHPARSTVSSSRPVWDETKVTAMRYAVVIEDAGSNFSAYVPDLPGCVATGMTLAEAESAIREAIAFHLDGLRQDGSPIPPASSKVEYVEVAA